MPVAPSQQKKVTRPALPTFKSGTKKVWNPPTRNTITVEDLALELDKLSKELVIVAAKLIDHCEMETLKESKDILLASARHLESLYNRVMNHGIMVRQQETVSVHHADDVPF